jgi:hypothetical protein
MEIPAEWIIQSLCLVVRLRIPGPGSDGRVAWKEFKGKSESVIMSVIDCRGDRILMQIQIIPILTDGFSRPSGYKETCSRSCREEARGWFPRHRISLSPNCLILM